MNNYRKNSRISSSIKPKFSQPKYHQFNPSNHPDLLRLLKSVQSLNQTKQTHALALVFGRLPWSANFGSVEKGKEIHGFAIKVVRALEGNLPAADLLKEIAPDNRTFHDSSDYDSSLQYKEDLKKFRKLAFETQDQTTVEYTGEHGAPPYSSSMDNQRDTKEVETEKSNTGTTGRVEIPIE